MKLEQLYVVVQLCKHVFTLLLWHFVEMKCVHVHLLSSYHVMDYGGLFFMIGNLCLFIYCNFVMQDFSFG